MAANNESEATKKCSRCNIVAKEKDLATHIKFRHERSPVLQEVDKRGKAMDYYCTVCVPPKGFSKQTALDQHKVDKH